ncbi:3-deoxy-8-phosphooctulonate synthase, partial [Hoeflea sp. CAU 1731]
MSQAKSVEVGKVIFSNDMPFVLIAGPCQIESRDHSMKMAEAVVR